MFVSVPVAALHVVLIVRVGETKILGNGVLPLCIYLEGVLEQAARSLLKRDPRDAN